jgi:hypothetical protein
LTVFRNGSSLLEEHITFSVKHAVSLAARNWPLSDAIRIDLVEDYIAPRRKAW